MPKNYLSSRYNRLLHQENKYWDGKLKYCEKLLKIIEFGIFFQSCFVVCFGLHLPKPEQGLVQEAVAFWGPPENLHQTLVKTTLLQLRLSCKLFVTGCLGLLMFIVFCRLFPVRSTAALGRTVGSC